MNAKSCVLPAEQKPYAVTGRQPQALPLARSPGLANGSSGTRPASKHKLKPKRRKSWMIETHAGGRLGSGGRVSTRASR